MVCNPLQVLKFALGHHSQDSVHGRIGRFELELVSGIPDGNDILCYQHIQLVFLPRAKNICIVITYAKARQKYCMFLLNFLKLLAHELQGVHMESYNWT